MRHFFANFDNLSRKVSKLVDGCEGSSLPPSSPGCSGLIREMAESRPSFQPCSWHYQCHCHFHCHVSLVFYKKSDFLKHPGDPVHLNSLILIREIVESRPCFHYTKMIASFYEIVSSLQEMKYSAIIIFLNILGTVCFTESGCVWNFGIGLFCQKRELSSKLKMCSTNCRLGWTLETVKIYFETKNTIINGGSTSVTLSTWFALFNLIKPLYTD